MARVLVVDDEEGVRSFLAEALLTEGHDVVEAESAQSARAVLSRQAFEVLVTDVKMPGESGIELLRHTKGEQPDTEVIVLTAHGTVDTAVEAMKLGAFDYLQKPLSGPAELRVTVSRALERRALLSLRESTARDRPQKSGLSFGAPSMIPVVDAISRVAKTQATVLLLGESGTGKEVSARAIHEQSGRAGPFVAINCAALTDTLLESELFGHEKGAFTGAVAQRRGRIELAEGGTFFLDEVAELKHDLQAKLLRVLQEKTYERVGGTRSLQANVRWVAATNRDLHAMMAEGKLREDLYHRLAVFPIRLPPLRDRKEDLIPLARVLLDEIARDLGRPGLALDEEGARQLTLRDWPGNIRELKNTLERAAILCDGERIGRAHLAVDGANVSDSAVGVPLLSLDQLERMAIEKALHAVSGNRRQAAEILGIGLRTLYDKLKRHTLG